jgi:hypothetical protein
MWPNSNHGNSINHSIVNGEISSFENYVNQAEIVTSRLGDNTEETLIMIP